MPWKIIFFFSSWQCFENFLYMPRIFKKHYKKSQCQEKLDVSSILEHRTSLFLRSTFLFRKWLWSISRIIYISHDDIKLLKKKCENGVKPFMFRRFVKVPVEQYCYIKKYLLINLLQMLRVRIYVNYFTLSTMDSISRFVKEKVWEKYFSAYACHFNLLLVVRYAILNFCCETSHHL